jgi:hypothetical protein
VVAGRPWRIIVRGAFQDSWSTATQEEKDKVFAEWLAIHKSWQQKGCRLIVTLDDELNMVGQPGARLWNFYSIWEVPDPKITWELLNEFRTEDPGRVRLDRYFRLETVVGMPITSLERELGGPQQASSAGWLAGEPMTYDAP